MIDVPARSFQAGFIVQGEIVREGWYELLLSLHTSHSSPGDMEMTALCVDRTLVMSSGFMRAMHMVGGASEFLGCMQELPASHQKDGQHPENPDMPKAEAHWVGHIGKSSVVVNPCRY